MSPHSTRQGVGPQQRFARLWLRYQWQVLVCIAVLALVYGCVGFWIVLSRDGTPPPPAEVAYRSVQLFVMEMNVPEGPLPWTLQVARFAAPVVPLYALLQAFFVLLDRRFRAHRLQHMTGHTIVCGLGRKGELLAKGFLGRGEDVVIIEENADRHGIDRCEARGALVVAGDARDADTLLQAGVPRARRLVAVCGNDGVNAAIVANAGRLLPRHLGHRFTSFVHISNPTFCNLLRERELSGESRSVYRLEVFDIFSEGARALLREFPPVPDGSVGTGPLRVVVVGAGRMGQSVVRWIVRLWRRELEPDGVRRTIALVDRHAERLAEALRVTLPPLNHICELLPLEMDVEGPEFQRAGFLNEEEAGQLAAVYICLDNDSVALAAGLSICQQMPNGQIPVVVRLTDESGLGRLIEGPDLERGPYRNLHAFGLYDHACRPDLVFGGMYESLARAVHGNYVRERNEKGEGVEDNPSLVPWEQLPEPLKESNRRQVEHIGAKLEAVGCGIGSLTDWRAEAFEFSPEQVELMAEMEHARWVSDLSGQGWRLTTGEKDPSRKVHPLLKPWAELANDEREIDRETVRRIPELLAEAGFQIQPLEKRTEET